MKERRPVSATYRFQFTKDFRFSDAEALVPYLECLGISHVYASPVLAAKPGSLSGYDTCDFSLVSPELGGEQALRSLVGALHRRGMGLIVDFVPNHMSAHPEWNHWWRSVLANGPSSAMSEYFDIDWYPANSNLHGKVLLAILGKQYGDALESGDLKVQYRDGEFCLYYGDFNLPLNPRQIKFLLRHGWDRAVGKAGIEPEVEQEFQSILFHLDHIPGYREAGTGERTERERETRIATGRLVKLVEESPALCRYLQSVIAEFNGKPGRPESYDLLHALLQQQPYRLSYWRTAMHEINYRRFFDVNELIGLRMEYEPLFRAAHAKLFALIEEGLIDGVRLDHIDGLLDPQQYLVQFREGTAGAGRPLYLIVEKILARQEWLNAEWPVDGATGYEYLALVNGLWVDEKNLREISSIYDTFCGKLQQSRDVVYRAKKLITSTSMASELNVLAHELNRLSEQDRRSRDFTLEGLREALREVVACFPVYRTYISERGFCPSDEMAINEAIGQARRRNPTLESSIYEFIRTNLLPVRSSEEPAALFAQRLRFAMKFQQYTSPVQAKGMEDTVFYRYSPLASLNEVGSGSGRRATTIEEFHNANLHRMERWPDAMLTTSTHDTKRGEDARMRIHVLTEIPGEWRTKLEKWSQINAPAKTEVNGLAAPDSDDEYLYYQSLLGMWPPQNKHADEDMIVRMKTFMNKALKEAKVHTSWINPSNEYDAAMERFVEETLRGSAADKFLESFTPFAERIAELGAWGSISQIAVKLMSPGVIDTYQGGELWDLSLVDPDNRCPVDFEKRKKRLGTLLSRAGRRAQVEELAQQWWSGDLKMLFIALGLGLRVQQPELLARGRYIPLKVQGPAVEHIVAFAREHEGKLLVTLAVRWFLTLLPEAGSLDGLGDRLRDTWIDLPEGNWKLRNVLTGTEVCSNRLSVAEALDGLPAAWLVSG